MRQYPERPIVGVGAVIVDRGRVVLVKRAHEPLKGEWSLPGGSVEVGETLAEAVVREVFEETGLTVSVGPLPKIVVYGAETELIECFALPQLDSGFYLATRADMKDVPRIKAFSEFIVTRMAAAKPILEGRGRATNGA